MQTCRTLRPVATKLLYAYPTVAQPRNLRQLRVVLTKRQDLAHTVRGLSVLELRFAHRWPEWLARLPRAWQHTWRERKRSGTTQDIDAIFVACPLLTAFSLGHPKYFCSLGAPETRSSNLDMSRLSKMTFLVLSGLSAFPQIISDQHTWLFRSLCYLQLNQLSLAGMKNILFPALRILTLTECMIYPLPNSDHFFPDSPHLVHLELAYNVAMDDAPDFVGSTLSKFAATLQNVVLKGPFEWRTFVHTDWLSFRELRSIVASGGHFATALPQSPMRFQRPPSLSSLTMIWSLAANGLCRAQFWFDGDDGRRDMLCELAITNRVGSTVVFGLPEQDASTIAKRYAKSDIMFEFMDDGTCLYQPVYMLHLDEAIEAPVLCHTDLDVATWMPDNVSLFSEPTCGMMQRQINRIDLENETHRLSWSV